MPEPTQSDSLSEIDVSCLFGENTQQNSNQFQLLDYPHHAFRCVTTPSDTKGDSIAQMDENAIQEMNVKLNSFSIESKIAGYLEFDQMDFLIRGLLLSSRTD